MRSVCSMVGTIVNPEKPKQSINELKAVGIHEIMFDFSIFISVEWMAIDRKREKPEMKPELSRKYYRKVTEALKEHEFLPSIAKLPFIDIRTREKDAQLNYLKFQVDVDCIRACESLGCSTVIVQPLFAGIERGREWEANREFYLALAAQCEKADTKILLINQCRDYNGHLMRGICSDGETTAEWIDRLNKEAGTERFGFCLDIGSGNLCGQTMQEMIETVGNRINAVILTENDGKNMAKLLPFTSAYGRRSTMDWLGVIRGLRQIEFDGCLILEAEDTIVSFSPLLQPCLMPMYKALFEYFIMQINIEKDLKKYKKIVLFGAGNMCRNYMKCYGEKYPPVFACDNNSKLWGTVFEGLEVKNPEELKGLPENYGVIICNIFYREIEEQLRRMGIENIGYFNDEYMPSFYFDRLKREE